MATPSLNQNRSETPSEEKTKGGWVGKAKQMAQQHYRATKALAAVMRTAWKNQTELRMLVTGKTGQGKSALINGILGEKVAMEGARARRCTTEVERYAKTIEGVPIKVFDSPGLQDGTDNEEEYIRAMKEQCKELSLVLYCTRMINTRLTDADRNAMIKLTKAFGENFWNYAVFVLTFANQENVGRHDERDEDDEDDEPDYDDEIAWKELERKRFEGRLRIWKFELQEFLKTEVRVSAHIADKIPVVPTGDRKITRDNPDPLRLPDRDNWFIDYWKVCCLRVKDTRLFVQVNLSRMVTPGKDKQQSVSMIEDSGSEEDEEEEEGDEQEEELLKSPQERFADNLNIWLKMNKLIQITPGDSTVVPIENTTTETSTEDTHDVPHSDSNDKQGTKLKPFPRTMKVQPTKSTPRSGNKKNDVIIDLNIPINADLISDVTAETVRRAGFDEAIVKGTVTAIKQIKKPSKWFMKLFRIKKRNDATSVKKLVEHSTEAMLNFR